MREICGYFNKLVGKKATTCLTSTERALTISYSAPNPKPFGDVSTPEWVPSEQIGKLIDKKYQ